VLHGEELAKVSKKLHLPLMIHGQQLMELVEKLSEEYLLVENNL